MQLAPRVTVVIPVHNGERYLRQALDSIREQTYRDWEAVIVDDASGDASRELAEEFAQREPDRFKVVVLDRNVGVAEARNIAMAASRRSELVALLDQDDYWTEHYLARVLAIFDQATARGRRVGIVACNGLIETSEGIGQTWADRLPWRDDIDYSAMLERNFILARALFTRAAFDEVGGFARDCPGSDDYDLWLRMIEAGYEVITTREPLVVYRVHSAAQSQDEKRFAEATIAAYTRALDRGALSRRQRWQVRARIRHNRALRERALIRSALSERRLLTACARATRAAPYGAAAFLQDPSRWAEWARALTEAGRSRSAGVRRPGVTK